MTAFATGLEALFADPNIAADVVYTPASGGSREIRVVPKRPDRIVGFGDTRVHARTTTFDLRVSEVASPSEGDRIVFGGVEYVVQGHPVQDALRLIWTVDIYRASGRPGRAA